MSRVPIFPIDEKTFEPDDEFFDQLGQLLASRSESAQYPILTVFKRMGKLAEAIIDSGEAEGIYSNLFLVHFGILAKFIYPMHEQIDAVLENHFNVSVCED